MTIGAAPICIGCKRFREEPTRLVCDAFPDGIPEDILVSRADHRQPFEGDRGLRFDPVDAIAAAYATTLLDE